MKLKFLGTGSCEGVPAMFCKCEGCTAARQRGGKNIRTRSQAIIDNKILIDFPADTYMHSLYGQFQLSDIHSVLLTHAHSDHLVVSELEMRCSDKQCFGGEECRDMVIYSSKTSGAPIEKVFGNEKAYTGKRIKNQPVLPYIPYDIEGYTVIPVKASHAFELDSYNYIIKKDGKSLFYAVDTGYFLEETWEYLEMDKTAFDVVVLESAYLDYPGVKTHMGISDNVRVRERLLASRLADEHTRFYITHLSHYRSPLQEETEKLVQPLGFEVAYDYLEIEI